MKNLDFKIKKIAEIFDAKLIGDKEGKITGISDIENAEKGDITFLSNEKYKKYLDSTKASAVIINKEVELPNNSKITFLVVKDSYLSFALLLLFNSLWFAYSRTIMTETYIYFFMILSFFLLLYSFREK